MPFLGARMTFSGVGIAFAGGGKMFGVVGVVKSCGIWLLWGSYLGLAWS